MKEVTRIKQYIYIIVYLLILGLAGRFENFREREPELASHPEDQQRGCMNQSFFQSIDQRFTCLI